MGGGLLNLVAYGNKNVIINGNPSKTFFKTTYAKYTNFGLQKFRIDFDGPKTLRESSVSRYEFTVPHYADLLMDTYFVITLPNIWSPIYCPDVDPPCSNIDQCLLEGLSGKLEAYVNRVINDGYYCQPYEFKWIENLGTQMIRNIKYTIGGQLIQEFTGHYLQSMVERDFSAAKKNLFNEMIGNTTELNDPANFSTNKGNYPNYLGQSLSCAPSIRGRKLYIPINIWSTLSSKLSIPLVCLQKNQLKIEIECRPVRELFVIRDINQYITNQWDVSANAPGGYVVKEDVSYSVPNYISTMNKVDPKYQMYLFLTQVSQGDIADLFPSLQSSGVKFNPTNQSNWYADPHLISTYAFIGKEETRQFVENPPTYLVKQVHENTYEKSASIDEKLRWSTTGLVSSWMWFFQRDDANLRNEWSNYTNWPYNHLPYPCIDIFNISQNISAPFYPKPCPPNWFTGSNNMGPNCFPYAPNYKINDPSSCTPYITGQYHNVNTKHIMKSWSLLCDGAVRESTLSASVLDNIEKYVRTPGNAKTGLYCYNFCLNTDPHQYQPNGAMNLTKFHHIEWEYTTFKPPRDVSASLLIVCDVSNEPVAYNKPNWNIYTYNYNLHIMEERYNLLKFENNKVTLLSMYG